ncbi:zinc-binding dehydrogenase [Streptomyces sp. NPDC091294]|uniref:zinc-binding dehydrogenase n=1 Tax=Streptomyces sp. NPDC091294 TaxID=3365992 RepID=UPI0037FEFA9C
MKAWQYVADGLPITLNDVAEPTPGPREVVLAVKAAGICHTDVSFLDGAMSAHIPHTPMTLGHEVAGVIAELGPGVEGFAIGDRVAVRADRYGIGAGRDGGFQPRVATSTEFLVPVPEAVAWDQAAVSTDAGGTAYRAITTQGRVRAGTSVGIIGYGGLGSLGARLAILKGARVFVAETNTGLHQSIMEQGASAVTTDVRELARHGLDVIVDFAGYGSTTAAAVESVRPGGRVVQVGLTVVEGTLNLQILTMNEVELVGSLGGSNDDNAQVLKLMAEGRLRPQTVGIEFSKVGEALRTLQEGGTTGRFVVLYDD